MNTLKGWITTTFLAVALAAAAINTNAGIIVGNRSVPNETPSCTVLTPKEDWGIIVGNVVGIIVGNLTGIIVGNVVETQPKDCKS